MYQTTKFFMTLGLLSALVALPAGAASKGDKASRKPTSANCERLGRDACLSNPSCEFYPANSANGRPADVCLSGDDSASPKKYCGLVTVFGTKSFIYATVTDNQANPQINGDTKDPKQIAKLLKNSNCYCVEGTVETVDMDREREETSFTELTGLYGCNRGPKIK